MLCLRSIVLFIPLVFLSGCTAYQYKKEICDQTRRQDVANLEGTYVTYSEDEGENAYRFVENELPIKRLDRGVYQFGNFIFTTCTVNGKTYLENKNAQYHDPLTDTSQFGFDLTELISGKKTLERTSVIFDPKDFDATIPYTLVDHQYGRTENNNILAQLSIKVPRQPPLTMKYLVIDNALVAPENLVRYGLPQFFSVRALRKETK